MAAVAALLWGCASGPAPVRQPAPPAVAPAPAAAPAARATVPAPSSAPQSEGQPMHIDVAAEQRFSAALDLIRHERYEQAEAMLSSITQDYPDLAGPYVNLGIVEARLGRSPEAERAFRAALERQPGNAVAYNQLGVVYREEGRFADARRAYERALELDASYAEAHLNLGILFDLYLQQPGAALEHYQRYRELAGEGSQEAVEKWIADLRNRLSGPKERAGS